LRSLEWGEMVTSTGWFYWALLSAVFAALTAIFAKVGIQGELTPIWQLEVKFCASSTAEFPSGHLFE